MAITEHQAQRVSLVRSVEQVANNGEIWSANDAKEATLATKSIVGEKCPFDLFVARRAELIIEQIAKRRSKFVIEVCEQRALTTFAWILIVISLAVGFITDHLMAQGWVNVIEWPIVLLICWNLWFVTYLLVRHIFLFFKPTTRSSSSLGGDILARLQSRGLWSYFRRQKVPAWLKKFETQWAQSCTTLNTFKISLLFHAASIAFAIGTLGSLYVRGLFKEYRAGWESTFISADTIHTIASWVLAPGAWLFNMNIPDAEHIAGIQIPNSNGEIAGDWIHLYAGSIFVCVIIPRLVLLAVTGYSKSRLQSNFPLPLSSMYYTTLRSIRAGYKAAVLTIPFRYELTSVMKTNLIALLEGVHGLSSSVTLQQSVNMGNNTSDWKLVLHNEGYIAIFVIFNLAATAELDTHGHLMQRMLQESKGLAPVVPIIDTSTYVNRHKGRFDQRCEQWRTVLNVVGCNPLFLDILSLDQMVARDAVAIRLYEYN